VPAHGTAGLSVELRHSAEFVGITEKMLIEMQMEIKVMLQICNNGVGEDLEWKDNRFAFIKTQFWNTS
jgi:hypothetical protein